MVNDWYEYEESEKVSINIEAVEFDENDENIEEQFYEASFDVNKEDVDRKAKEVYIGYEDVVNMISSFKRNVIEHLKYIGKLEASSYRNLSGDEDVAKNEVRDFIQNVKKYEFFMFNEDLPAGAAGRIIRLQPVFDGYLTEMMAA